MISKEVRQALVSNRPVELDSKSGFIDLSSWDSVHATTEANSSHSPLATVIARLQFTTCHRYAPESPQPCVCSATSHSGMTGDICQQSILCNVCLLLPISTIPNPFQESTTAARNSRSSTTRNSGRIQNWRITKPPASR